jgi:uncharacterized protein YndB with AHSA1/START domain
LKSIRLFQELPAKPGRIYQALADPLELSAWQADVVRGQVQVGRNLSFVWPGLGVELELEVTELVQDRSIVLTSGHSSLSLRVVPGGVELDHTAHFSDDTFAGTESSWKIALATLATYLGYHFGRPRQVHWAVSRARASVELCHAYFTDARLLSSWLGHAEESIGAAQSQTRLTLGEGRTLNASVLTNTPGRDLALRWPEAGNSVLVMRTLPAPEEPESRNLLLGWYRWGEVSDAAEIAAALDQAVDRLGHGLDGVALA